MSAHTTAVRPDELVKIRTLHVLFGEHGMADLRSVRCPAQQRAVALEHCLSCEDSAGVVRNEMDAEYVWCRGARAVRGAGRALGTASSGAGEARTSVSSVMTTDVLAARADASTDTLLDVLIERGFGGAPVVDGEGRPIGVFSRTDFLGERFLRGRRSTFPGRSCAEPGEALESEGPRQLTVGDVMTRVAFTVPESAGVPETATLMGRRGIHRVIVVSDDGRVTGVVTSSDIVRWVAERAAMSEG